MTPHTGLAVVGASCRLPGRLHTPEQLWSALLQGRDLVTDHAGDHPRADILPAGILDQESLRFDATHWGLSATEVAAMDPQQKLLLELADEAFQDAGMALSSWRGRRVGLWVGTSCLDQALLRLGPGQGGTMVDTAGAIPSMLANRVTRHGLVDWRGPSEVIDTACSASLVALHRARQALALGEVDLAVVAGTSMLMLDTHTRMFAASGVLSPDGRVHAFDRGANGFVRGEGGAVLVLQRQGEAHAAGLSPRAVLVASSTNSDGSGNPIGAPNARGQVELLEHAWSQSSADADRVGYIEAHGTGTGAGDRAEARALAQVLGQGRSQEDPLLLGSVKTNLGHLEGAAGIVSALKVVLSLQHQQLAPTIHHSHPLPLLAKNGLQVPTTARLWPEQRPLAGVSAFGFGGTNAHLVFAPAQPAPPEQEGTEQEPEQNRTHVIPVSASTQSALRATAASWSTVAGQYQVGGVAATAGGRRDHHRGSRAAVVAADAASASAGLAALGAGEPVLSAVGPRRPTSEPTVVFLYAGHGAHPEPEIAPLADAAFAQVWEQAQQALDQHTIAPRHGLARAQPDQWAWQIALTAALARWGLTPDVVVGHSLGEVAAAHTAGVLDTADAAHLVTARARLLEQACPRGSMLATSLTWEKAHQVAQNYVQVDVAAHNGEEQVVLSGSDHALEAVAEDLHQRGHQARLLGGAPPAHSRLLEQHACTLSNRLRTLDPQAGHVPLYSTATGTRLSGQQMGHRYWGRQLRQPVLLHPVIDTLARQSRDVIVLEIGARSVLSAPVALTLARAESAYALDTPVVSTALAGPAEADLVRAVAELYTRGLDPVWPASSSPAVPLPLRTWHHPDPAQQAPALGEEAVRVETECPERAAEQIRAHVLTCLAEVVASGAEPGEDEELAALGVGSLALAHLHLRLTCTLPGAGDLPAAALHRCTTPQQLVRTATDHVLASATTSSPF